ncbi:MAG: dUTP diphosphatase [Bacteriovoracia bacterium]
MPTWSPPTTLAIKKLTPTATLPTRAHPEDAGMDLYASTDVVIGPGQGTLANTGIAMALPVGFVGMIADRSSLAKKGIKTAGGIIDAGYRGEIMIVMRNLTQEEIRLARGERIAQMLVIPVGTPAIQEVSELDSTARGAGGFGSTGR